MAEKLAALASRRAVSPSSNPHRSLETAKVAARVAAENKGRDVHVLDLRSITPICDYFVVATGSSRRQLHAIAEEIDRTLVQELNDHRLGMEGYEESRWILLDYGDVVVHLFDEETREYYDLEGLWAEAPLVDLSGALRVAKE